LCSSENPPGADPLPNRFDIERISTDEHASPTANERRGSDRSICRFPLPEDALIRVDPYVRLRSMDAYLRGAQISDFEFGPLIRRTVSFDSRRQGWK
jgi:hypothetical protein